GVGDTTDIVQKEMYTFEDKGGRSLTLRPEATAGVVRSYIENGMSSLVQPVKLMYNITAYRYENVQKGRYREFNQLGVEAFGCENPGMDVEIISMLKVFFDKLGLQALQLNINSIGCPACREAYNGIIREYYKDKTDGMCGDCRKRFERNPLRIIDCKEPGCDALSRDVPYILDNLCPECKKHFDKVKEGLSGLGIEFAVNKKIVRGLDYYTKTVFEFISDKIGAQATVCAGGRYDGLVESLGGGQVPGIGFSMGTERLLMVLESGNLVKNVEKTPVLYIATIGNEAYRFAFDLVYRLRQNGIYAETDLMNRSIKAQMKYSDKKNSKYVIVLGQEELETNKALIRIMATGEEKQVSVDSIFNRIKENKI
ncbi:MAG: histidine--tRNA ligase, partial [Clostridia bacterium]